MNKSLYFLYIFLRLTEGFESENSLKTSKSDIKLNLEENDFFRLFLSESPLINKTLNISLSCDSKNCNIFEFKNFSLNESFEFFENETSKRFTIHALEPGHDVIIAHIQSNHSEIDESEAFVRVRVGRGQGWAIAAQVVGWIYFFVWSASFWPQNVINFRRKSVVGYNLDFAALNVTGFLFYAIYNSGIYFSSHVRQEYELRFPRSEVPIELNDVIYAFHAAFATGITLIQCYCYDRGDQQMSLLGKLFTGITWSAALVQLVLCLCHVMSWLAFLYYFSYVKLVVTSVKYIPQAWFNYKRKSTKGWSILMIYLDFCGGINGLLQMVFIAFNFNDWKTIFGNFAKFGLSIASISYDCLFFLQQYVFYGDKEVEEVLQHKKKSDVSFDNQIRSQSEKRKSIISVISAKSVQSIKKGFNYGINGENLI